MHLREVPAIAGGVVLLLLFFFLVASTSVSLSAKSPLLAVLTLMMLVLLRDLKLRNQWVPVQSFQHHGEALAALIRTGHVEFSSIKGRLRATS